MTMIIKLEQEYPNVYNALKNMGADNNIELRTEVNLKLKSILDNVEKEAMILNSNGIDNPELYDMENGYQNEIEILCMGELEDQKSLINKKNINNLDQFLTKAFDGEYYEDFFYPDGKECGCVQYCDCD